MTPDPLCMAHALTPSGPCYCRALATARLQGPVRDNRHAPICWCAACLDASTGIHGGQA